MSLENKRKDLEEINKALGIEEDLSEKLDKTESLTLLNEISENTKKNSEDTFNLLSKLEVILNNYSFLDGNQELSSEIKKAMESISVFIDKKEDVLAIKDLQTIQENIKVMVSEILKKDFPEDIAISNLKDLESLTLNAKIVNPIESVVVKNLGRIELFLEELISSAKNNKVEVINFPEQLPFPEKINVEVENEVSVKEPAWLSKLSFKSLLDGINNIIEVLKTNLFKVKIESNNNKNTLYVTVVDEKGKVINSFGSVTRIDGGGFPAGSGSNGSMDSNTTSTTIRTAIDSIDLTKTYVGEAVIASLESSPVWRIKLVIETATTTKVIWADGDNKSDNVWDNRESLTYL